MADLRNCNALAHANTIVIVDDICESSNETAWSVGPTRAWKELVQQRIIQELGHETYELGRGMSWGKYIFPTRT